MKNNKELVGCVYYFFANNESNKKDKKTMINKITKKDFFIRNELTNVKKIQKIQKYKNNYYVCDNSSELQITELNDENENEKTKYLNSCKNIGADNTILLIFEDLELINFKNYLKDLSPSNKYIATLINFYKKLLNSIYLLVDKQIIHNNINFDSIMVDKKGNPLLSNFSFSLDVSHKDFEEYIKHFIIAYEPSYIEWPLEFHILSYLLTNKLNSLSNYNLEQIICNIIDNHSILNIFGETLVSKYKEEALQYFKKYVNRSYEYILTDILQYSHTWDNYALSIMFLRILIGIHRTIGKKNKFIILFMKLLVTNIHLNPLKRLSIDSTTNKFESILDSLEPKDYKELLEDLTSA